MTNYDVNIVGPELNQLKHKGRLYLKDNQIGKALLVFLKVLDENPSDLDALLIIGDAYVIIGEFDKAYSYYEKAFQISDKRNDIKRRLDLLEKMEFNDQPGMDKPEVMGKSSSIGVLLKKISGQKSPVTQNEINNAKILLNEFLVSHSPAEIVAEKIGEINELLPALIELKSTKSSC